METQVNASMFKETLEETKNLAALSKGPLTGPLGMVDYICKYVIDSEESRDVDEDTKLKVVKSLRAICRSIAKAVDAKYEVKEGFASGLQGSELDGAKRRFYYAVLKSLKNEVEARGLRNSEHDQETLRRLRVQLLNLDQEILRLKQQLAMYTAVKKRMSETRMASQRITEDTTEYEKSVVKRDYRKMISAIQSLVRLHSITATRNVKKLLSKNQLVERAIDAKKSEIESSRHPMMVLALAFVFSVNHYTTLCSRSFRYAQLLTKVAGISPALKSEIEQKVKDSSSAVSQDMDLVRSEEKPALTEETMVDDVVTVPLVEMKGVDTAASLPAVQLPVVKAVPLVEVSAQEKMVMKADGKDESFDAVRSEKVEAVAVATDTVLVPESESTKAELPLAPLEVSASALAVDEGDVLTEVDGREGEEAKKEGIRVYQEVDTVEPEQVPVLAQRIDEEETPKRVADESVELSELEGVKKVRIVVSPVEAVCNAPLVADVLSPEEAMPQATTPEEESTEGVLSSLVLQEVATGGPEVVESAEVEVQEAEAETSEEVDALEQQMESRFVVRKIGAKKDMSIASQPTADTATYVDVAEERAVASLTVESNPETAEEQDGTDELLEEEIGDGDSCLAEVCQFKPSQEVVQETVDVTEQTVFATESRDEAEVVRKSEMSDVSLPQEMVDLGNVTDEGQDCDSLISVTTQATEDYTEEMCPGPLPAATSNALSTMQATPIDEEQIPSPELPEDVHTAGLEANISVEPTEEPIVAVDANEVNMVSTSEENSTRHNAVTIASNELSIGLFKFNIKVEIDDEGFRTEIANLKSEITSLKEAVENLKNQFVSSIQGANVEEPAGTRSEETFCEGKEEIVSSETLDGLVNVEEKVENVKSQVMETIFLEREDFQLGNPCILCDQVVGMEATREADFDAPNDLDEVAKSASLLCDEEEENNSGPTEAEVESSGLMAPHATPEDDGSMICETEGLNSSTIIGDASENKTEETQLSAKTPSSAEYAGVQPEELPTVERSADGAVDVEEVEPAEVQCGELEEKEVHEHVIVNESREENEGEIHGMYQGEPTRLFKQEEVMEESAFESGKAAEIVTENETCVVTNQIDVNEDVNYSDVAEASESADTFATSEEFETVEPSEATEGDEVADVSEADGTEDVTQAYGKSETAQLFEGAETNEVSEVAIVNENAEKSEKCEADGEEPEQMEQSVVTEEREYSVITGVNMDVEKLENSESQVAENTCVTQETSSTEKLAVPEYVETFAKRIIEEIDVEDEITEEVLWNELESLYTILHRETVSSSSESSLADNESSDINLEMSNMEDRSDAMSFTLEETPAVSRFSEYAGGNATERTQVDALYEGETTRANGQQRAMGDVNTMTKMAQPFGMGGLRLFFGMFSPIEDVTGSLDYDAVARQRDEFELFKAYVKGKAQATSNQSGDS
ncbi:uncharacterized protein BcabD6B2_37470 [Babesia caballi]|uniref:Uncharacterized protein n=1 Tax=Babesia caballi TaxID=5871 RepID=A0AAV4LVR6_BABCB|nr:hypothetical protein, conserved [Babesia caballi]